jgi:DNA-binding transcriptional ArsR family regulator
VSSTETTTQWIDQRLVKALAHPLRVRLLAILNERVASPNELAKETGEPLGNVSYHVRLLADLDCVELVRTAPRRGAVEHYYRATVPPWFDKRAWADVPKSLRSSVSSSALSVIVEEAAAAMHSGAFDSRADRHVSRAPLMLDEDGWNELAGMLDELLERALELKGEAANRAVESGSEGDLIPCSLVLLHYPTPRAS